MPRAALNKNLLMKRRNTNVAIMVLWQGKNGEPGLDVSNLHSKHPPIIIDTFNGLPIIREHQEYRIFCLCMSVMHVHTHMHTIYI